MLGLRLGFKSGLGLEEAGAFKFRAKGPFIAIAQIHE